MNAPTIIRSELALAVSHAIAAAEHAHWALHRQDEDFSEEAERATDQADREAFDALQAMRDAFLAHGITSAMLRRLGDIL